MPFNIFKVTSSLNELQHDIDMNHKFNRNKIKDIILKSNFIKNGDLNNLKIDINSDEVTSDDLKFSDESSDSDNTSYENSYQELYYIIT
jgi:hypothetical protein